MISIPLCVKIIIQICTILSLLFISDTETLILNNFSNDSSVICPRKGNKHRFHFGLKDSLSYINKENFFLGQGPRIRSDIASQRHILEKERFIIREGPVGFQTIEKKEDPNVSNKTLEVVKKLKEKVPNANIIDIWKNFKYSGSIHKGHLSGRQLPAKNVSRPNYYKTGKPIYVEYPNSDRGENDPRGTIKTEADIRGIRKACRIAREILDYASALVVEGIFTDDIDRYIHKLCAIKKVFPATLNYHGFPKSVCTSINEVACHGIPDNNVLAAGDLLKVDLSIFCNGYFGDVCETYMVMPMRKDFNKRILKTNYMGRTERNKLIHRSVKHSNLHGAEQTIITETSLINQLNNALKSTVLDAGLFNLMKQLFTIDLTKKFSFTQDENTLQLAKKLCDESRSIYETPEKPYEGRIVGLPDSLFPTHSLDKKIGKIFATFENPQIVVNNLDLSEETRYNKPYVFSHSFEKDLELMKITHEALMNAISICKPGTKIKTIGKTIEKFLEGKNCRSLTSLCGHGIGRNFHENPVIFHETNDIDVKMEPGMVFTIEPIVTRSKENSFMMWPDGWTITTLDGSKTAQFEHTILITEDGHEILTDKLPTSPRFFWETSLQVSY